jgi:hypothetical protein
MRVLICSTMLRILIEFLINIALISLFERRSIGRVRDPLVFCQEMVKVQLLFLHSLYQ